MRNVTTILTDDNLKHKAKLTLKDSLATMEQCYCINLDIPDDLYCLLCDITDNILESKEILSAIMNLKAFDDYTFYHCINVCILSFIIGKDVGFNKDQLYQLCISAVLHDIGKTMVPKDILNKKGRLTSRELEVIKKHSSIGYHYAKEKLKISPAANMGILHHHEKYDGSGYPLGKKSNKISLYGRIISVADVFDAFVSDRPYRKALPPFKAVEYILGNSGTSFDPDIVKAFSHRVVPYPVGSRVILNNNKIGLVIENFAEYCTRPKVKIYKHGDIEINPYYLDLREEKDSMDIVITNVI